MWAGLHGKNGWTHDCGEKRHFASSVECAPGDWESKANQCSTSIGNRCMDTPVLQWNELQYFKLVVTVVSYIGCYHNSIHKLSTTSVEWAMFTLNTSELRMTVI